MNEQGNPLRSRRGAVKRELALLQGMARRPSAWLAVPVPSVDQFVALAKVKRRSGQRIDEVALGELVEREGAGV